MSAQVDDLVNALGQMRRDRDRALSALTLVRETLAVVDCYLTADGPLTPSARLSMQSVVLYARNELAAFDQEQARTPQGGNE